jgi:hypothetical protein
MRYRPVTGQAPFGFAIDGAAVVLANGLNVQQLQVRRNRL